MLLFCPLSSSSEEVRRLLRWNDPVRVGDGVEDARLPLLGRAEVQYRGHVPAPIAVVGRRPHRHQLLVEHVLDALVDQLVCPADQVQLIALHKVVGDEGAEQPAGPARTLRPVFHVLGVGPHQVAEGALVRDFLVPIYRADLVERLDLGT